MSITDNNLGFQKAIWIPLESTDELSAYERGVRQGIKFAAYLLGEVEGNITGGYNDKQDMGLQHAFEVGYIRNPLGRVAHQGFVDSLGIPAFEYVTGESELVHETPNGHILRQVVVTPTRPDAAFVSYWAQRRQ